MSATLTQRVCPAWCTTSTADHADDDPARLLHDGPEIVEGILAVQAGDGPVRGYFAQREGEMTAEQLRALARACDQAAAWIEAQR